LGMGRLLGGPGGLAALGRPWLRLWIGSWVASASGLRAFSPRPVSNQPGSTLVMMQNRRMTQPRCSQCPRSAWLCLQGQLLCEHCGALTLMRGMIDTLEQGRINPASPGGHGEEACGGATNRKGAVSLNTGSAPTDTRAPLNPSAGVASGPQDSIPSVSLKVSDVSPAAPSPSAPAIGAAGNSFGKQCIARLRRNATTLRVTADNSIQGSSSHI
jgi:hypothetical protein